MGRSKKGFSTGTLPLMYREIEGLWRIHCGTKMSIRRQYLGTSEDCMSVNDPLRPAAKEARVLKRHRLITDFGNRCVVVTRSERRSSAMRKWSGQASVGSMHMIGMSIFWRSMRQSNGLNDRL